ncbi:hypothetical protein BC936DRAFT_147651, partial [Jimgerdemannia flammicorona]
MSKEELKRVPNDGEVLNAPQSVKYLKVLHPKNASSLSLLSVSIWSENSYLQIVKHDGSLSLNFPQVFLEKIEIELLW